MKRLWCLVIFIILALTITACNPSGPDSPSSSKSGESSSSNSGKGSEESGSSSGVSSSSSSDALDNNSSDLPVESSAEIPVESSSSSSDGEVEKINAYKFSTSNLTTQQLARSTISSLSAKDSIGREVEEVYGVKKEKYVGIFYMLWLQNFNGIYDIPEILKRDPDDLWNQLNGGSATSPMFAFHWWGKPLYGYYNSLDPWVMRRHVELLTMADVDFICFDVTNGPTYDAVWKKMLPILSEYQKQGFKVPKVVFMTNNYNTSTTGTSALRHLYDELYAKNYYPDTWFNYEGKPLVITNPESEQSLPENIRKSFSYKYTQWPDVAPVKNAMPWMDWVYPQTNYDGAMNVSVAQNTNNPMSAGYYGKYVRGNDSLYNVVWGRGFDFDTYTNSASRVAEGSNFEQQWATAHSETDNLEFVFVTGWNEWVAQKYNQTGPAARFVDAVSEEFSRDIEMTSGVNGDNYYLQLVRNVRKFKYNEQAKLLAGTKSLSLSANPAQWNNVGRVYVDFAGDAVKRDYIGAASTVIYKDNSNRNDIVKTSVVNDSKNLYMLVETKDVIKRTGTKTNWMNILLKVQGSEGANWNGYQYIVNRYAQDNGKTSLEKAQGNGFNFTKTADIGYAVDGKYMMVTIPLNALGIKNSKNFSVELKVADNITNPGDIMDYYVSGDSAPIGRLNYTYNAGR